MVNNKQRFSNSTAMNSLELNHKTFKAVILVNKIKNITNNIVFAIINNNIIEFVNYCSITHNQIIIVKNRPVSIFNRNISNMIIPTSNSFVCISNKTIQIYILFKIFINETTIDKLFKFSITNNYITFTVNNILTMITNIRKKIITSILNIYTKNVKKLSNRISIFLSNNFSKTIDFTRYFKSIRNSFFNRSKLTIVANENNFNLLFSTISKYIINKSTIKHRTFINYKNSCSIAIKLNATNRFESWIIWVKIFNVNIKTKTK